VAAKDAVGNALHEGNKIVVNWPRLMGTDTIVGTIVKITEGGLSVAVDPKNPHKPQQTPGLIKVVAEFSILTMPQMQGIQHLFKIVDPELQVVLEDGKPGTTTTESKLDPTKRPSPFIKKAEEIQ
jgi:hypothetical protein